MKRFSLRNKDKIIIARGEKYYELLIDSLKVYFEKNIEIVEYDYESLKNNKIVIVPSFIKNSEIKFEFAIISKTYDVYNLAYYSSKG